MAPEEIFEAFLSEDRTKTFFHGHTFTANPIACAAACANLADECVHAEAVTALRCAELCGDAIDMIRDDFAIAVSN